MGGHHPQPHLARPVLAGRTTGDTVRLQVHVPKGHLLPLDAELAHAACGRTEVGGGGEMMLSPLPHPRCPPKPHHSPMKPRLSPVLARALKSGYPPRYSSSFRSSP